MTAPYQSTPQFTEESLPDALRNAHNTKEGVWGLLVVEEGDVRLVFHDPARTIHVRPDQPAVIPPQAIHHVEVDGPMRMHVEFYHSEPLPPSA